MIEVMVEKPVKVLGMGADNRTRSPPYVIFIQPPDTSNALH